MSRRVRWDWQGSPARQWVIERTADAIVIGLVVMTLFCAVIIGWSVYLRFQGL